ncbi:hypothetical protein RN001_010032 [Aquatica leii]|uniref:DUF243 domain-containing protein n=1 Tax=Aquatica leii TaxID=1421715 RepID=A0AAN7P8T8_9COLE|nr:hypothetical protein RN001_010032 [Aquatica leii]
MKLYVLVSFCIAVCAARPDASHLLNEPSIAYLPSRSGSVGTESQVVQITAKPNVAVTTFEPTKGTQTPKSFEINRQFTGSTTYAPSSSSTSEFNFHSTTPTAATNFVVSTQKTSATVKPSLPAFSNALISGPSKPSSTPGSVHVTTFAPQPTTHVHLPDESHITETRFNVQPTIQKIPTGSYLPINTGIQVPQTNFGDGSFLTVPGHETVHHIGAGQKSVYFYAAPDDDEIHSRLRINILPSSQSSTRVIFIKAPAYAAPIPEVYSAPSDASDKTVIYVLSKKPDAASAISIPTNTIVKPSKPEIYFIKYGSQQEAQQAIASGLHGNVVGENIQDLLNEHSFIQTIKDGSSGIGTSGIHGTFVTGGVTGSVSTTPSIGTGTITVTTAKPSKGTHFGPAGESGPY